MLLKMIARALILPPSICLILILIGAFMAWRGWRFGRAILLLGVVSVWVFCTPVVADWLLARAERYPALDTNQPVNAQAVVVLGGGRERLHAAEYNGGAMTDLELLERVTLAAYLARHYSLPLAISGAPEEAIAMSQTLSRNFGVSTRWIEGRSRDTYENAQLSARLLFPEGVKRIILVTSSPHEWRAAQEFMAAGFNVIPAPAGMLGHEQSGIFKFIPAPVALMRSNAAVYELIGEPMRRLLAASGVRERFDSAVTQPPRNVAPVR